MEPGSRPALHSRLPLFPSLFGAPQVWGCRRRRMNESESQAPRCPRHSLAAPGRAERRSWRVDRRPLASRRAANSASGAGERGSKPRESRCSSAPTRAPRLSRCSPLTLRAASQSPGQPPPPHTSITAHLRRPPALARQSRAGSGGLKPAAASASTGSSRSGGRRFPSQRRPREPSAAAKRAAEGGGGGGENRGRDRSLPPARGRGREAAAAAAEHRVGAGGWRADPSRGPPEALRAMGEKAAAARAAGRLVVRGRAGPRGELVQPAGPSVRPSFLPSPPLP